MHDFFTETDRNYSTPLYFYAALLQVCQCSYFNEVYVQKQYQILNLTRLQCALAQVAHFTNKKAFIS